MTWTPARIDQLKQLWSEGKSASQIASIMGGTTRNAVIGKVHRLGLGGRKTVATARRVKPAPAPASIGAPRPAAPSAAQVRKRLTPSGFAPAEPIEPMPEPEPLELGDGSGATILTLTDRMCKWPIGDPRSPEFHFCGRPVGASSSYCAYHMRMAYLAPNKRDGRDRGERPAMAERAQAVGGN
jgi:GcrA cell cycle regulator